MTLNELRTLATGERGGDPCWGGDFAYAPTLPECELLHSLVAAMRPLDVLELGTGAGVSAMFIAWALDGGCLTTVEPDPYWRAIAEPTLADLPVILEAHPPRGQFDLVFIDSGYQFRHSDIERWLRDPSRPLVVVHDAKRDYPEFRLGVGAMIPTQAGIWIGRGK